MASMSAIPSPGSLPNRPTATVRDLSAAPVAGGTAAPVPDVVVASDQAQVRSGQEALSRIANTSLWSMDYELPSAPAPVAPAKKPWDYSETPDITLQYLGGASGTTSTVGSQAAGPVEPEEEDLNFLEMITWPMRTIAGGVVEGGKAVVGAWQGVGQAVGEGAKQVVGAVGHGVQQAASFVGEAASNAWKAVTSFRLW